ncbi:MAG: N-acetyltransferase [Neisseriaceae bacterium]|nr:N-acetyltransferase [Neisseriaceae bacterium]MBP6861984.1 N-acetyltransferase [Neisseriaceae bacterium]
MVHYFYTPFRKKHIMKLAQVTDLQEVMAIYNASLPYDQSAPDFTTLTQGDQTLWFDAHKQAHYPLYAYYNDEGIMVAWASFSVEHPSNMDRISAEISIYLAPAVQNQGLGSEILGFMLNMAPILGIHNVLAIVYANNQPSLRLFKKYGFEQWGFLPQVSDLHHAKTDVIILGKAVPKLNRP